MQLKEVKALYDAHYAALLINRYTDRLATVNQQMKTQILACKLCNMKQKRLKLGRSTDLYAILYRRGHGGYCRVLKFKLSHGAPHTH